MTWPKARFAEEKVSLTFFEQQKKLSYDIPGDVVRNTSVMGEQNKKRKRNALQ